MVSLVLGILPFSLFFFDANQSLVSKVSDWFWAGDPPPGWGTQKPGAEGAGKIFEPFFKPFIGKVAEIRSDPTRGG